MEATAVLTITAVLEVASPPNRLAMIDTVPQVTPAVVCMVVRPIEELTEGATVPLGVAVEVEATTRLAVTWEEGVGAVPAPRTGAPNPVLVALDLLSRPVCREVTHLVGPHPPEASLPQPAEGTVLWAELLKTSALGLAQGAHHVGGPLLVTDILNTLESLCIHSPIVCIQNSKWPAGFL